jgi:DNA-binding CsgD family transcriptional regulator
MEFKNQELIPREIEIAGYLLEDLSLKQISEKTGLSKKHLAAHIRNMMEKLGAENVAALKKIFRADNQ